ncbi:MAG: class I SAM-dependent methyltransferase [Acidobacteriota bacterium]
MRGCEQIPWLYDGFMRLTEPFGLGRWRQKLVRGVRGQTLEVGSGTGRNLPLYDRDARVVALDPDLAVLLAARKRAPSVPLVVGSAETLPFRPATFETVVSGLVFCSVPNPQRGLLEVARVLTQDGQLRMMEHVRHPRPSLARLQDTIQPSWTWLTGGCHPNRDTEATVAAAGFVIDPASRRGRGVMRRFVARRP